MANKVMIAAWFRDVRVQVLVIPFTSFRVAV
jgi:hypothetical protein